MDDFTKMLYLCNRKMAIGWLMPSDVRESGESPEQFLLL